MILLNYGSLKIVGKTVYIALLWVIRSFFNDKIANFLGQYPPSSLIFFLYLHVNALFIHAPLLVSAVALFPLYGCDAVAFLLVDVCALAKLFALVAVITLGGGGGRVLESVRQHVHPPPGERKLFSSLPREDPALVWCHYSVCLREFGEAKVGLWVLA